MASRQTRIIACLIATSVIALNGCRPGTVSIAANKQVAISSAGAMCNANPDSVTLSSGAGDTVTWTPANAAVTYTIKFDKTLFSPFTQSSYTLPPAGMVPSGAISLAAKVCANLSFFGSCDYPYSISGNDGCKYDPHVIITP
jgi:hypothetical protein